MRITKHICFFYIEKRIIYINNIIDETNTYRYNTDIFIHTNINISPNRFNKYTNGSVAVICHDLSGIDPFYLSWKCRNLLYTQKDEYDIFMYIEDDILVPYKAIEYWLAYNDDMIDRRYNLGFVRIEIDKDNTEYITDLHEFKLNKTAILDGDAFCINDKNPYCAFWIYNKREFNRFVDSEYYDIRNINAYYIFIGLPNMYGIRESSGIGLHGWNFNWYKTTLIPIIDGKLHPACKIYHMANNYSIHKGNSFGSIKFDEAIE